MKAGNAVQNTIVQWGSSALPIPIFSPQMGCKFLSTTSEELLGNENQRNLEGIKWQSYRI